jgi:hypothetical protein
MEYGLQLIPSGRNRLLFTSVDPAWAGATNSDIKVAGASLNNYLNLWSLLAQLLAH